MIATMVIIALYLAYIWFYEGSEDMKLEIMKGKTTHVEDREI